MRVFLFRCAWKKALNLLKKGLLVQGEAMEASKRRRSILDYKIQQLSIGSSEGSGTIPEVLIEPKDNSGSSSSSLSGSNDEEENKAKENKADAKVAEKQAGNEQPTTSIPTPPTTQAQVTNVSESDLSLKFEQRLSKLEKKVEVMPKRAWTKKDHKQTDEMFYAGFSFLSEFETRWWSIKLQFFWELHFLLGQDPDTALLLSIHPNADNAAADALSRLSANVELHSIPMSSIEPELLNKIKASWVADVDVKLLIQKLENQTVPNKKFTLKNRELRRKGKLVIGNNDTLRSQLIKVFHNEPLGGHSCIQVSLKKLSSLFYWKGKRPNEWTQWLSVGEYWYNTNFHTSINTTPFEIVYGQASTFHIPYVLGTSNVDKVDRTLAAREEAINVLKFHLRRAQDRMKAIVDGHKTDRQYDVGDGLLTVTAL
ncbi:putative mitochondrial protein [Tanacetum coccineum]